MQLHSLNSYPDITDTSFADLYQSLRSDPAIASPTKTELCQLDPRDGAMVIYAEHRALRQDEHQHSEPGHKAGCPICSGQLTHVVDFTPLSNGFSFISQNLFPMLNPVQRPTDEAIDKPLYADPEHKGRHAFGFHLLQWTSSVHQYDWHNLPYFDALTTLKRLAIVERKLLTESSGYMPPSSAQGETFGYVSIIKNYGAAAGASLSHGHQQIGFSNIMPQRMFNNQQFFNRHQRTISEYLFAENPACLTIAELGNVRAIVPYFMRRPFNIQILLNSNARHLHELTEVDMQDLCTVQQKIIQTIHKLLPRLGREVSFNMAIHSGPDNHLYLEYFPMIQLQGGFERIGMWICQLSPEHAAEQFREIYHGL